MIVPVSKNDEDTLSAFRRLGEDYWSALPDTHRGRFIQGVIDRIGEPDRWLLLLKHEDEYIGFTHFKIDRDDKPGWGLLMELYIISDKRRLGWGRRFYKHIERILRERNVENVWLTTDPKAEDFWSSFGFKETGIIDERNNMKIMIKSIDTPKIVVMVLRDDGRLLFGKSVRAENHLKGWTPLAAGGHIEEGETAVEAIVREAKEELGVDVEVTRLLGSIKHREHILVFECKLLKGEPKPDPRETEEIKWVPIQQVKEFSSNVLTKKVLALL